MPNNTYLYSLSNRPATYKDRPETICGLSEFPYCIPFIYRLLMSGDPQPCASLVFDKLGGTPMPLYAINSPFGPGFERVKRFVTLLQTIIASSAGQASVTELGKWLEKTLPFLEAHRDRYLLLETIEVDMMTESDPAALRALIEAEIKRCRHVGDAFAALPEDTAEAARILHRATAKRQAAPLDAFFGLRIDDDYDTTRGKGSTRYPLGLYWSETLFFDLWNRERFEARQSS